MEANYTHRINVNSNVYKNTLSFIFSNKKIIKMIYNYILSNFYFLTFKDNTFIVKIEEQGFFQYTVNFEFQLQFETENATHVVYNLEDRPLSINIGLVAVSPNSTYCCVAHKFLVKNRKPINYIHCKSLFYVDNLFSCFKGFRSKFLLQSCQTFCT